MYFVTIIPVGVIAGYYVGNIGIGHPFLGTSLIMLSVFVAAYFEFNPDNDSGIP